MAQAKLVSSIYRGAKSVTAQIRLEDDTVSDAFTVIARLGPLGQIPQSMEHLDRLRSE